MRPFPVRRRAGFTIVELLVSLAIIAVAISLLLSALGGVREASRKTTCMNHARQLGLAVHNYESSHPCLPPGNWRGVSMFVWLLPQLEQSSLHAQVDFNSDILGELNAAVSQTQLSLFRCPSDGRSIGEYGNTNYAGNAGTGLHVLGESTGAFLNGFETLNRKSSPLRSHAISDGLSNTMAFSEILVSSGRSDYKRTVFQTSEPFSELADSERFVADCETASTNGSAADHWSRGAAWASSAMPASQYDQSRTPNQSSCTNAGTIFTGAFTATSNHRGGVQVVLCDSSVRFLSDGVDLAIWRAIGTRNGNETLGAF